MTCGLVGFSNPLKPMVALKEVKHNTPAPKEFQPFPWGAGPSRVIRWWQAQGTTDPNTATFDPRTDKVPKDVSEIATLCLSLSCIGCRVEGRSQRGTCTADADWSPFT